MLAQTQTATVPPTRTTRRNSDRPAAWLGKNCKPSWHITASNAPSLNGKAWPSALTGQYCGSSSLARALMTISSETRQASATFAAASTSGTDRRDQLPGTDRKLKKSQRSLVPHASLVRSWYSLRTSLGAVGHGLWLACANRMEALEGDRSDRGRRTLCHCEERSDEAISTEIASLRSQ